MNSVEYDEHKEREKLIKLFFPDSKIIKRMIKLLTLVTIVGSIITIAASAYKADVYSRYYGIPVSNMDFSSTAKEMVVILGPLLLIFCIGRFVVLYAISCIDDSKSIYYQSYGLLLVTFSLLAFFPIYYFYIKNDLEHLGAPVSGADWVFGGCLILFVCCLTAALLMVFRRFTPVIKHIYAVFLFVVILLCLLAAGTAAGRIKNLFSPEDVREYELLTIDDKDYVVICGNDKKLVLECEATDDYSSLVLLYGRYRYISSEDYSYVNHSFSSVERDID